MPSTNEKATREGIPIDKGFAISEPFLEKNEELFK